MQAFFCVLSHSDPGVGNTPATGCTIQHFEVVSSGKSGLCVADLPQGRAVRKIRKLYFFLLPILLSFCLCQRMTDACMSN